MRTRSAAGRPSRKAVRGRKATSAAATSTGAVRLRDLAHVRLLAHPLRLRLLEAFRDGARTTHQVALELGEKPTRLYHHVDALAAAGLLQLEETRRKRGTVEKYYRTVPGRIEIAAEAFGGRRRAAGADAVARTLLDTARREIVATLRAPMGEQGCELPLLARARLRLSGDEAAALRAELAALLERARVRAASTTRATKSDQDWALVLAMYPAPRG